MKLYFKLLRVSHWVKNLFIFLPLFFSGNILTDIEGFSQVSLGFILFSLIASSIYIINDLKDIESDRLHPEKKNRPFASGIVPVKTGILLSSLLFIGSITAAYLINPYVAGVLAFYFAMNIAYSFGLKHVAIVDITIIAMGFLLRVMAGGLLAKVFISHWIIIMTFLLALFLGLAKRRDDVLLFNQSGQKMRKSVDGYNLEFINTSMVIMAAVVIVAYIMYTISEEVVQRFHTRYLYATSLFVILGIIRYLQITFVKNKSGNPTKILLNDRFIQLVLMGWILAFFIIIYLHKFQSLV
jgi:4-hydroxybenzoate polyprenyltransferase